MATDIAFNNFTLVDKTTILNSDYLVGKSSNYNREQSVNVDNIANVVSKNFVAANSFQSQVISGNQTLPIYMGGNDIKNCVNLVKAWVNFNGFGGDLGYSGSVLFPTGAPLPNGFWSASGTSSSVGTTITVSLQPEAQGKFAAKQRILVINALNEYGDPEPNINGIWTVATATTTKITFNIISPPSTTGLGVTPYGSQNQITVIANPVYDSYNVRSITRRGAGQYTIYFTNALKDNFYSYAGMAVGDNTTGGTTNNYYLNIDGVRVPPSTGIIDAVKTSDYVNIIYQGYAGGTSYPNVDSCNISFIIFGN